MRATRLDETSCLDPLVASEIIEDDYVARRERGGKHALHVGAEDDAVHGAIDDKGRDDAVMTQASDEGGRLPVSVGYPTDQSLSASASAVAACHVGLGPGLIDEDELSGIKRRLVSTPPFACRGHVWPVLLAGQHGFF